MSRFQVYGGLLVGAVHAGPGQHVRLLGQEGGQAHDHVVPVVREQGRLSTLFLELFAARRHALSILQLENSPDEDLVPDPKADLRVLPAQELPLSALCVGGGRALVAVDIQRGLVRAEPNELLLHIYCTRIT